MGLYERIRSILQDSDGIIVIEGDSDFRMPSNHIIKEDYEIRVKYKTEPRRIFRHIAVIRNIPFFRKPVTNFKYIKKRLEEELRIIPETEELDWKPRGITYSNSFMQEGIKRYEEVKIIEIPYLFF